MSEIARRLPSHLVSLVHHVELNKAGWWTRAVQQLIVTCLLSEEARDVDEICASLASQFSVTLTRQKVQEQIAQLLADDTVVRIKGDRYQLTQRSVSELGELIKAAQQLETSVKARFVDCFGRLAGGVDAEAAWQMLHERFLLPVTQELGAHAYELLCGGSLEVSQQASFQHFLECFPGDTRDAVREAVVAFIDPNDHEVRAYLLRYLNAFLLIEAGNLSEDSLRSLNKMAKQPPSFTIFADTNFIFSALGLHDNPSNNATRYVMSAMKQVAGRVNVKLSVLPITLEEARAVLKFNQELLQDWQPTPRLAQVVVNRGQVSGFAMKYAEAVAAAGHAIQAEDYFDPYSKNLLAILRSNGIELHNEPIDLSSQEIADEVCAQLDYEQERYGRETKSYEAWERDIGLWHFVQSKRPLQLESPLDANYWVVTVDYRFLGFDAFKCRGQDDSVPICVHPTALMQMLELWIPRTIKFEQAFVSALRPILSRGFDPAAERVTISILSALARFEEVDDLPEETITGVLMNEALRQRLPGEASVEKHVELVKEALIEEHARVAGQLRSAEAQKEMMKHEISSKTADSEGLRVQLEDTVRDGDRLRQEVAEKDNRIQQLEAQVRGYEDGMGQLRAEVERGSKYVEDLQSRLTTIEEGAGAEAQRAANLRSRGSFCVGWGIMFLAALAMGWYCGSLLSPIIGWPVWGTIPGTCAVLLAAWLWTVETHGERQKAIQTWRPFIFLGRMRRWLFGSLGTILLGALGSGFWDLVRPRQ